MALRCTGSVWILFYFQIISFLADKCPETVPTLRYVKNCPENKTAWIAAAKRKQCNNIAEIQKCTTADEFVYHCVLTDKGTRLVEVCAPQFYLNGYCTAYDIDVQNLKNDEDADCSTFETETPCPTRYLSTDSYKYKECYKIVKRYENVRTSAIVGDLCVPSNNVKSFWIPVVAALSACLVVAVVLVCILTWCTCLKRNKDFQNKQSTDTTIPKRSLTPQKQKVLRNAAKQEGDTARQSIEVYEEEEIAVYEKYIEESTGKVIYLRYPDVKMVYTDLKTAEKKYEEITLLPGKETV